MIVFLDNDVYQASLVLLNLAAILVSFFIDTEFEYTKYELDFFWRRSTIFVNSIYLLDLLMNMVVHGMNRIYVKKKWLIVEMFQ